MNDSHLRKAVNRWGLHVVCLLCRWRGRHRPEQDGRLRFRSCPRCNVERSLRLLHWAKTHEVRANEQRRELLGLPAQLELQPEPEVGEEPRAASHPARPRLDVNVRGVLHRNQPQRPSIPRDLLKVPLEVDT